MRLGIEFNTFDGWVLLGLDGLGLRPLVQRHLAMGTRGGVWQIRCEPEGSAARCCAQCDGVEEIGVDEHVWRHTPFGSRYVTIIVDLTPRKKGGTARLLDMVEGRSEKAFATWLQERGQAFRERVRVVAMVSARRRLISGILGSGLLLTAPPPTHRPVWRPCR